MRFRATNLSGCHLIEPEPRIDDRGFFARLFCAQEFLEQGLDRHIEQINNSFSRQAGTLRGLHYQVAPAGEVKLVRCIHGAIYDVVVDLRRDSPTFLQWIGETITAETGRMMYVPRGCAHGFVTLKDNTEVMYPVTARYDGAAERVLRWNDTKVGIRWPLAPVVISDKDKTAVDYDPILHASGY